MKLAARAGRIVPSPTLSITATAKAMVAQGIDVIEFASGEPDFDTPDLVKDGDVEMIQDLTVAALNEGKRKVEESLKGKLGGMLPPGMM